eukprot:jgi/Chrzof1/8591/Cz03g16190.t1
MPGFGNSFKPRTKPSDISYYTKSILEALDQLGIHGPIDAIGHHTGVCVFLDMAVSNPKRVSKLACWGIPILSEEFRNKLANETPPELDPEGKRVGDWWKWVSTSKHVQNDVHNAIRYTVEWLQMYPATPWPHNCVGMMDVRATLQQVQQPVLSLAGDNELEEIKQGAKEAVALLPRGQLCWIEGGNIDVQIQMPEVFVEKVLAFLDADD